MKKCFFRLTMALIAVFSSLGMYAQTSWADPTGGGSFYLYNVDAGRFMNRGNDWGTRGSALETGEVIKMEVVSEGVYRLRTNNGSQGVFRADNGIWMDGGGTTSGSTIYEWVLTQLSDGFYTLTPQGQTEALGMWADSPENTRIDARFSATRNDDAPVRWAFITADQYNAAQATVNAAINARAELRPYIICARAMGFTSDEVNAFYDITSTAATLQAALNTLPSKLLAYALENGTEENPMDLSFLIKNRYCAGTTNWNASGASWATNNWNFQATDNACVWGVYLERWVASANALSDTELSQNLSGLPVGGYILQVDAVAARQDGNGTTITGTQVFAEAYESTSTDISTPDERPLTWKTTFVTIDGNAKVGFKQASTNANWVAFDNFKLYFVGVTLDVLKISLNEALTKANAIDKSGLNTGLTTILEDAISEGEAAQSSDDKAVVQEATNNLNSAVTFVNKMIVDIVAANAEVVKFESVYTNSEARDKTAYGEAIAATKAAISSATTVAEINSALVSLETARQTYVTSGAVPTDGYPFDMTFKVTNPDFATDMNGWTGSGTYRWYPGGQGFDGNSFIEFCDWGAAWNGSVSQTLTGLTSGTYIVKAAGQAANSNVTVTLTANGVSNNLNCIGDTGGNVAIGGEVVAAGSGHAGWQYMEVECNVTDGTLTITGGASATTSTRWANFDHVTVSYVAGADLAELVTAYETALTTAQTTAEGTDKVETAVKSALTTTISTYGSVDTTDRYAMEDAIKALGGATADYNASVEAYASAKAYLDRMALVLENTNVYTQEAYNEYYGTYLSEYNAGTLATSTAATLNANLAYRIDNGYKQANNLDEILLSSWTIGGEEPVNYDKALYINTWSTEGATDGSEFLAPFFEYWTDDANSLEAKTIQATITGLKPSTTYSFTIRARVRQTNNQTKIANGITMQVGSGETVDISSGTIFGTGPFFIGNFSAVGETDADGKLTATITVAANSNISWLSFYNAKYTEGEDLSAYIADYEFALANATAALSKGMDPNLRSALQSTVDTYSSVDTTNKTALITAKEALDAALTDEIRASVAELEGSSINGWAKTGNSANFEVNTWSGEGATDGSNMTKPFLQNWQGAGNGALGDAVMTYTLTGQAQGYYKVSALIRSLNENGGATPAGTFIFANTAIERAYNGTACTNGVYDEPEVYGYVGADGNLSIGVKVIRANVNWVSFKNFKVEYVGTELTNDMVSNLTEEAPSFTYNTTAQATLDAAVSALSGTQNADNYVAAGSAIETAYRTGDVDLTELNTAIANAEAAASGKVLGFATGEYAPYNNVEVITALATAKAIDQATATDQTVIINATNALNAASWNENTEEVNAIYDGSFEYAYSTDGNVKPFGWHATNDRDNATNVRYMWNVADNAGLDATSTGKALFTKYEAYYGQETGYTMPLKANTIYELTFVYGGWDDCKKDGYVTVTAPNDDNIEVTVSRLPLDATNGHQDATAWKSYKARFQTSDAGNYVLGLRKDNDGTTTQSQYVYGDMKLFTAKAENIGFTFKADYGTLILPFDAELQEGMEAYTCDGKEENELTLTLTPAESFVANTPYIVKKTGATTDYTFSGIAYSTATTYTDGLLTGTLVDMTAPAGSLVLQNQPSGLGFYQVDTNDITVKANRVYVTEEVAGVNVRALILPGNETGINSVVAEDSIVDVYTIGGVKVKEGVKASEALNGLAKGFYIVGGKKVMK